MEKKREKLGPGPENRRQPPAADGMRLLPAVTFGLRAAVLAGVVVLSAPGLSQGDMAADHALTTTTLGSPISGISLSETSCCSANDV
jgi:hypothetical protein